MKMAASFFTHALQWSDVDPKPPCNSALIKTIPAQIYSGDDIIVRIEDERDTSRVIDIQSISGRVQNILVNIWVSETSIGESNNLPDLNVINYNNVCGMKGVLKTNWTKWVSADQVLNFSYAFHCDLIQCGRYANAHEMSNAFLTR